MTTLAVNVKQAEPSQSIAWLSAEAMYREVKLTPKPGLVDSNNNGAHRDMTITHFMASIHAVTPWFPRFFEQGKATANLPASQTLLAIRPTGLACEQAMFKATGGINTHKGGIFHLAYCAPLPDVFLNKIKRSVRAICAGKPVRCVRAWLTMNLAKLGRQKPKVNIFFNRLG